MTLSIFTQALNPSNVNDRDIQWYFRTYWQTLYKCPTWNLSSSCNTQCNNKYNRLTPVRPVLNAVYAVANGLRISLQNICHNVSECKILTDDDKEKYEIVLVLHR